MTALLLLAACASSADPGNMGDQPGIGVAEAALHSGAAPLAMRIDDGILAKDPHNVAALINRGDAQTAQQQFDAAAESYTTALHFDAKSVQARIGLARLHLADDPHAAETLFLEALQRDPRNAVALNDLGIARDLLGHHAEAQAAYRQAIGIDATMHGAQVNLALSLAMAGRAEDAVPMLRPLADAPNATRNVRDNMAAVLAMSGDRSGAQNILAQNLPPEQVDQAIAIFTAASPTSGAAHPIDAAPVASVTPAGGTPRVASASVASASVATAGIPPASAAPISAGPANTAPVSTAPTSVVVTSADHSSVAPADAAPISVASARVIPVSAAPVSAAPASTPSVSAAPPASVALASASPASADPVTADPAVAVQITAGPASGTAMVQLSTTATRDAAQADWRRIQHHLPDLLALHQPVFVQTGNEGNVRWGVRTDGFAGPDEAKAFCGTIKARGFGCFVTLAQNPPSEQVTQASAISSAASPTPDVASTADAGPGASATQVVGQSGVSPASAAPPATVASVDVAPTSVAAVSATPINAAAAGAAPPASTALASAEPASIAPISTAPISATPASAALASDAPASDAPASEVSASADPATARPAGAGTMVQLSTTATRDAAKADWRRIQHHLSDLLSDRQPAFVQTDSAGNERWGVRTGGFGGYAEAKDFCDTIKARGFGCFVTGS
jgi:Flp pilus assembly protein TadD